jgi:hypothetical protein
MYYSFLCAVGNIQLQFELYDQYYSSIKSDLDALEGEGILKVAGIIAFFRNYC